MYRKILMGLVWVLSVSASAGESIIRISDKVFSVKHEDGIDLSNMSSNQLIDLLKSNEVYELKYSRLGKLIKASHMKIGSWTEAAGKATRVGTWTETGARILNANNRGSNESAQNHGE